MQTNSDYASYELTWEYEAYELTWDYEAVELVYELDSGSPNGYERMELQDGTLSVLYVEPAGFSMDEEAFFSSEVNSVLVIEEPSDTISDRAHAALARFSQRAKALLSSTPARASS
jgi:hypothetical protein